MELINIGFGNVVSARKVVAVVSPESAPIKRLGQEARDRGMLIDASFGRKTKSVLIMYSGHGGWASLTPEVLGQRFDPSSPEDEQMGEQEICRRKNVALCFFCPAPLGWARAR